MEPMERCVGELHLRRTLIAVAWLMVVVWSGVDGVVDDGGWRCCEQGARGEVREKREVRGERKGRSWEEKAKGERVVTLPFFCYLNDAARIERNAPAATTRPILFWSARFLHNWFH